MTLMKTLIKTLFMPLLEGAFPSQLKKFSLLSRNAKIINVIESQKIKVYQTETSDNGNVFTFVVERIDTLMGLDPYHVSESDVQALGWINLWETEDGLKPSDDMSVAERVYTLLERNQVPADDVEVNLDHPDFEIVHLFFA